MYYRNHKAKTLTCLVTDRQWSYGLCHFKDCEHKLMLAFESLKRELIDRHYYRGESVAELREAYREYMADQGAVVRERAKPEPCPKWETRYWDKLPKFDGKGGEEWEHWDERKAS